jgi:hypothetical protein
MLADKVKDRACEGDRTGLVWMATFRHWSYGTGIYPSHASGTKSGPRATFDGVLHRRGFPFPTVILARPVKIARMHSLCYHKFNVKSQTKTEGCDPTRHT